MVISEEWGKVGGTNYYTEVIPASSLSTSDYYTINCGFAPKYVVVYRLVNNQNPVVQYIDFTNNTLVGTMPNYFETDGSSDIGVNFVVDGDTLKYKPYHSGYVVQTRVIIVG